jgi:hypothetical protein
MNKKHLTIAILSTLVSSAAYAGAGDAIADLTVDTLLGAVVGVNSNSATSLNSDSNSFTPTIVGNTGQDSSTSIQGNNIYIGNYSNPLSSNNSTSSNNTIISSPQVSNIYIGSQYGNGMDKTQLFLNGQNVGNTIDKVQMDMNQFQTKLSQTNQEIQSNMSNVQDKLLEIKQQTQQAQQDTNNNITSTLSSSGLSNNLSVDSSTGKIVNQQSNNNINNQQNQPQIAGLTVQNQNGDTHGFFVDQTVAVMSGGTHSTSFSLDDNGATLSNSQTGAPVQLHGVANGTAANDAVNFSQLNQVDTQVNTRINQVDTQVNTRIDQLDTKVDKNATRAFSGIAQIAAMQAIPAPIAGKNYSIGMGGGFYAGQQAMAFGGKANVGEHLNVSASVANGFGSNKDMAASVGAGFSW